MLSVRRSNVFSAAPVLLAAMLAGLGGTAGAQTLGGAGGPAGDATQVEKCDAPKGTLAVVEPQDAVLQSLFNIGLKSPTGMLRVIVQQSNCFQIVERGTGFQNLMQERALAEGGQLQSNQNVGKGQMVAADFVVTPSVVFSNPNAGGVGGALAGFGGKLGMLGALAGGLKFKEAQTSLVMADTRSGIQVAAAEGSAQKTDFNIGAALFGSGGGAALGGYGNTSEGKIVAASFLDNWNNIVRSIRNNPSLIQAQGSAASQANAAGSVKAGAGAAGDIYVPKIAGVKAFRSPAEGGATVATLSKTDEVIFEGEESNGFMKVATPSGSGWVKSVMMRKQ
ncbi:MAG TPA: CsgG/HfaB family protein [Burkholderiaceae bacterium]